MSDKNVPNPRKAFCVHAHFYQPPREDPRTGVIPNEPGAQPYDNWNEKIYDQCYRPNAELGNFGRISFNIGPTLFGWLEKEHPDTYRLILDQENEVFELYGFSNAMAQSYNHSILPLASHEDKVTQVQWGIADYVYRFGHAPQGMWMPETAVDMDTLRVMADAGIEYTIMAPWQGGRRGDIDCSQPYRIELGEGKSIVGFFYDADLSMKVSFVPESTVNADGFMYEELRPKFPPAPRKPHLHMIATDGELYGHHQPFRDKFLEWLTTGALEKEPLTLTFPALYLRDHPVTKKISVKNNTSWSCHHGIKRWSGVCDCAEHGEWKGPMRHAFNRIADYVDNAQREALAPYGVDFLEFRGEYIHVLTGEETADAQITRLLGNIPDDARKKLLLLMRAQYERQRMFTSCGWFFGEFDRIEARNNLSYAAIAVSLLEEATGCKDYYRKIYRALNQIRSAATGVRAGTLFANAAGRSDD